MQKERRRRKKRGRERKRRERKEGEGKRFNGKNVFHSRRFIPFSLSILRRGDQRKKKIAIHCLKNNNNNKDTRIRSANRHGKLTLNSERQRAYRGIHSETWTPFLEVSTTRSSI